MKTIQGIECGLDSNGGFMQRLNTTIRDQEATAAIQYFLLGNGELKTSTETLGLSKHLFGFMFNEFDSNGNTLLMYILLLASKLMDTEEDPIKKHSIPLQAEKLIEVLFTLTLSDPRAHLILLITQNHDGKTPLSEAMSQKNGVLAKTIIREARLTKRDGNITTEDYTNFLYHADSKGLSPLDHAVFANNIEGLEAYTSALNEAYEHNIIMEDKCRRLVIGAKASGYTPLHVAMAHGSPELLRQYLTEVKKSKFVSWQEYKALLLACIDQENVLFFALSQRNTENFKIYLAEVRKLIHGNILKEDEIRDLFFKFNKKGVSPFIFALSKRCPEIVELFLEELRCLNRDGFITQDEYKKVFIYVNSGGFNPLLQILKDGNVQIFEIYMQHVVRLYYANIISAAEYKSLMLHTNQDGFNAMQQAAPNDCLSSFINYVKSAMQLDGIKNEDYKKLLIESNCEGFNPLLAILKVGNLQNLKLYLREVRIVYENNTLSHAELKALITSANSYGYTTLHQVANCGNVEALKEFVEFIEANFVKEESAAIVTQLLTSETKKGFVPTCHDKKPGAQDIFKYLGSLREKHDEAVRKIYTERDRRHSVARLSSNNVWTERSRARREDERDRHDEDHRRDRSPLRKNPASGESRREETRSYRKRY